MLNSLKENLKKSEEMKSSIMNGANKTAELFERATTDNRVLRNELDLVKETNMQLKKDNTELAAEVLKKISKISDISAAHEFDVCNWITEKGELEQDADRERLKNLQLEKEIAMLKGKLIGANEELSSLKMRGLFGRIFRVGEQS